MLHTGWRIIHQSSRAALRVGSELAKLRFLGRSGQRAFYRELRQSGIKPGHARELAQTYREIGKNWTAGGVHLTKRRHKTKQ